MITLTLDNQRIKNLFARVNIRILPRFCSIINYLITALPLLGAKSSTWMNNRRSLHRDNPDTAWNSSFIVPSIISTLCDHRQSEAVLRQVEKRRRIWSTKKERRREEDLGERWLHEIPFWSDRVWRDLASESKLTRLEDIFFAPVINLLVEWSLNNLFRNICNYGIKIE